MSNESYKEWIIVVNKECSIKDGYEISCYSKSNALNLAEIISKSLYSVAEQGGHVFVLNREYDSETYTFKTVVINHYSVICDLYVKMILLYDGFCDNQREIVFNSIN